MEHDLAAEKITDWVRGRLPEGEAAEIAAHVRECAACREAVAAARGVAAEVAEHGAYLFSPHPAPELLASFVLDPDALSITSLAECRGHVAACPVCAHDAALLRAANAPSVVRALRAWLPARLGAPFAIQAASTVLALLLIVPAYRGLIELPRLRAQLGAIEPAPAPAPPAAHDAWNGGGMSLIVLSGPTRGAAAAIPTARIAGTQPAQPILIDAEIAPRDSFAVRVLAASGAAVWSARAARADLWDESHHALGVLVPASVIPPGVYRLEIMTLAGQPLFGSKFRTAAR